MKYFRKALYIVFSDASMLLVYLFLYYLAASKFGYWPAFGTNAPALFFLGLYFCEKRRKRSINFVTKDNGNESATWIVTPDPGNKISGTVNEKRELTKLTVYANIPSFFGFEQK